jgi:hypothetical protein
MAIFALHSGVSSQKRKTILVIFHSLDGNIPALNSVALRAIRAHFPLVNVRVAVLAILAYVGKDWLGVALQARHFFVHAAKRIFGVVMIELRHGLDGAPTRSKVAVLARNGKWPVGTTGCLLLMGKRSSHGVPWQKHQPT